MSAESPRAFRLPLYAGLALAGVGLAHFTSPTLFDSMTRQAFPRETRKHVYIDGGVETALGLGLVSRRTRKFALAGGIGYLAYLGANAARVNSAR